MSKEWFHGKKNTVVLKTYKDPMRREIEKSDMTGDEKDVLLTLLDNAALPKILNKVKGDMYVRGAAYLNEGDKYDKKFGNEIANARMNHKYHEIMLRKYQQLSVILYHTYIRLCGIALDHAGAMTEIEDELKNKYDAHA